MTVHNLIFISEKITTTGRERASSSLNAIFVWFCVSVDNNGNSGIVALFVDHESCLIHLFYTEKCQHNNNQRLVDTESKQLTSELKVTILQ